MMTREEAIKTIVQALEMANKAGVYSLNDSFAVVQAINKIDELVEIVPEIEE